MNIIQLLGAVELGLIYGLVAIGVYMTFRVIDFPDLTVDGSFPMGAAIAAALIVSGTPPWIATLCAMAGGACAGFITGYLNVRWKIMGLLAGILTMTGLYSINLRIMGRPNIALLNQKTLFKTDGDWINPELFKWLVLGLIVTLAVGGLIFFIRTELGLAIRATGANPKVSRAHGVRTNWAIIGTLCLSNAIVGLAGACYAQMAGFADITLGQGTIIIGLASVIVGEVIVFSRKVGILIIGCILGSILYRIAVAAALNVGDFGLKATDMKLITAILIAATMILPKLKQQLAKKKGGA